MVYFTYFNSNKCYNTNNWAISVISGTDAKVSCKSSQNARNVNSGYRLESLKFVKHNNVYEIY